MNKVINGKKYDTDTAKLIGHYRNGDYGDFFYIEEELYLKKTGEFFLYGSGGGMTKYREEWGKNRWSGSSHIFPYTIDEAKEWAMEHMSGDAYEEVFGPVEE